MSKDPPKLTSYLPKAIGMQILHSEKLIAYTINQKNIKTPVAVAAVDLQAIEETAKKEIPSAKSIKPLNSSRSAFKPFSKSGGNNLS